MMYRNILVPIAFDREHKGEDAIRVAMKLCDPGGRITLFRVVEEVPGYISSAIPAGITEKAFKDAEVDLKNIGKNSAVPTDAVVI